MDACVSSCKPNWFGMEKLEISMEPFPQLITPDPKLSYFLTFISPGLSVAP